MKEKKKKIKVRELIDNIRQNRPAFAVFAILRLLVIIVLIRCIILGKWESVFVCSLTLVLFLIPPFVEKQFSIELPTALEITVYVFVFCAEILGEVSCYYVKYPFWDTALHTTSGFIFAAFGFCLLDILNRNKKVNFSPITLTLMAFCFSMTIGVLWEFFEFAADLFIATDMQKDNIVHSIYSVALDQTMQNKAVPVTDIIKTTVECADGAVYTFDGYLDIGIIDTMKDLFVNFVGAVVFCTCGYFYIVRRGGKRTQKIVENFVPTVSKASDDIVPEE